MPSVSVVAVELPYVVVEYNGSKFKVSPVMAGPELNLDLEATKTQIASAFNTASLNYQVALDGLSEGDLSPLVGETIEIIESTDMNSVRVYRDELLAACDWTQLADSPLDASKKSEWAIYRQSLRDYPEAYEADNTAPWPTPPSK